MRSVLAPFFVITMVAAACGTTAEQTTLPPSSSTSTSTSVPATSTTSSSSTTTSTTTTAPSPVCDDTIALSTVEQALALAGLASGVPWSSAESTARFADRTAGGATYAERLGLDCGLLTASGPGGDHSLALAAWTGARVAFVVQTLDVPATPFGAISYVQNPVTEEPGEFLDEDMSIWAVSGPDGESIVIGHLDYSLGAASKEWSADPRPPFEDEVNLAAEEHGIAVLAAAGMRNIAIAQPPEFGSEEGYLQFISPTGQISVADVAPSGWFDPMLPRYFTGDTVIETIDSTDIRITLPTAGDGLGLARGAEVAFACTSFVWILEPPFNGTVDEMLATARAVVTTPEC